MSKLSEGDLIFFKHVLEMVRQVPIEDIVYEMYGLPKGFCPFHNDNHAGSFAVNKRSNSFCCYSCSERGDGIDFVKKMESKGFVETVNKIALYFQIITLEQLNGEHDISEIKAPPKVYDGIFQDDDNFSISDPEVLNNVFSLFIQGESLIRKDKKISQKHLVHLKEERKLSEQDIENGMYFTIPKRSKLYLREFLKELKIKFNYTDEILENIPGFYRIKDSDEFTFVSHSGIGIPMLNEKKQITGIQIRRDRIGEGEQRYIWFSSSFANEKDDLTAGTGSGSPVHVSYAKENKFPTTLYITEGKFKSEQISKHLKTTTISIQGVQNWKGKINSVINYMEEDLSQPIHRINICFDSDISENINVYKAFKNMYKSLKLEFPFIDFYYYWWNDFFGKGIDDLLMNYHSDEIKKINCELYINNYDRMIQKLKKTYEGTGIEVEGDKTLIRESFDKEIIPLFQ